MGVKHTAGIGMARPACMRSIAGPVLAVLVLGACDRSVLAPALPDAPDRRASLDRDGGAASRILGA
jgi:hypothetical protein